MRESILAALRRGEIIVCDGAMGTMLQARGLTAGVLPEVWNAERPEVLRDVHRAYLAAGAQIITANTFGGNRLRAGEKHAERAAELNRLGVLLAREVADERAWVAGDIGPTGQIMEPYGPLSVAQAEEVYTEQVSALAEAGADLLLIETMSDIEEACCAVRMARTHSALPVFCTFSFNTKGRTMMGLRPSMAAQRVQEAGGHVVGANCGEGPAAILAALREMKEATSLPLMAQANAGVPSMSEGATAVWDVTPEQMGEHVRTFVSLGARIVGGCCGTGPAHIAAVAAALHSMKH